MKFYLVILLTIIAFTAAGKGDDNYAYSNIQPELLTGANAVVRNSTEEVTIISGMEVHVKRHYAITILNKEGAGNAIVKEYYSNLITIDNIRCQLYDRYGKEIGKVKNNTIKDISVTGDAFFDDNRYKICKFDYDTYPYTFVYDVEETYSSCLLLSQWQPQEDYDIAVEMASIEISYPDSIKVNYKATNVNEKLLLTTEKGIKKISMQLSSLHAVKEPDELTATTTLPEVAYTTDNVIMDNVKGSLTDWKSFGSFLYKLNANRDILPYQIKQQVHLLTDTCTTNASKIKIIYAYVQQNTRYVNISLGIGGWQTHDAKFVAEKGYGDCKALSNYTRALLKEAGITSYQAFVYGTRGKKLPLYDDFPYKVFNHAILCVPGAKDSIWLDCTSKDQPTGYLETFTNNRKALLLTPAGGYVVRTPTYGPEKNYLSRTVKIDIDDKDGFKGKVNSCYSGLWWERQCQISHGNSTNVSKYLDNLFAIPTYTTENYKFTPDEYDGIPAMHEQVSIEGAAPITKSGEHIFLSPKILKPAIASVVTVERNTPFSIANGLLISDTVIISLSGSYVAEKLPNELNYDLPFASFHSKVYFDNGNLLKLIVTYSQKEGTYPAAQFADYLKLNKEISNNAAYGKVILNKKA